MTIRRTLYPGFQDALCPVQPPASLEWLGIFDSEGFPGRKSVRLVRPRILPSNYRRGGGILRSSTLIPSFVGSNLAKIPTQIQILSPPILPQPKGQHFKTQTRTSENIC